MNETVVNGSTFLVLNGWDCLILVIIVFFLRWVECAVKAMCKCEEQQVLPVAVVRQVRAVSPMSDTDDSVSSRAQSEEENANRDPPIINPISRGVGRVSE